MNFIYSVTEKVTEISKENAIAKTSVFDLPRTNIIRMHSCDIVGHYISGTIKLMQEQNRKIYGGWTHKTVAIAMNVHKLMQEL